MHEIKDSKQVTVRIGYDGRVHKNYHGHMARERFENEVRILRYLEGRGCVFVPKILQCDEKALYLVSTNCGAVVDKMSDSKVKEIFDELESYGVRHGDAFLRNVTYNARIGRFCLIDFEFATILETGEGLTLEEVESTRTTGHERQ